MTPRPETRAVMIQGTGSNVGKSMLVAGLARAYSRRGLNVAPFKPQNMSNNAAVTVDGGEIGRAQALQARAAGRALHSDMNPVLLKPESETGSQVIVQGKRLTHSAAAEYGRLKRSLMPPVLESFRRLEADADLVLIEGAGSPAEINLRAGDIANMGFARAAKVPVILVGDIDRGGVIAQLVGTQAVLDREDAAMVHGFAVNRFRGDISLFDGGRDAISERTGWACLGVVPWFDDAWRLPAEDILDLSGRARTGRGGCHIVVPQIARLANFDDLDPLAAEPDVTLTIVPPGRPLPGDADLVLLPGSKTTLGDLTFLRAQGWDVDIAAHLRRGGHVLGICGGYQMLGHEIRDPDGVDGVPGSAKGLGHLDVETVMGGRKHLLDRTAVALPGREPVTGYEIHMGNTEGPDCTRAWLEINGVRHGAATPDGRVMGCYMHGIFASDPFRRAFLARFGATSEAEFESGVEATLDKLADHLERYLDLDAILAIASKPASG